MKPLLAKEPRLFPCCICGKPREVRTTKKGKPYLHCDPCGLQMFVRIESGIQRFEALCAQPKPTLKRFLYFKTRPRNRACARTIIFCVCRMPDRLSRFAHVNSVPLRIFRHARTV